LALAVYAGESLSGMSAVVAEPEDAWLNDVASRPLRLSEPVKVVLPPHRHNVWTNPGVHSILFEWIREVVVKFKMPCFTWALAIQFIVLAKGTAVQCIPPQLLALAAMKLACELHDEDNPAPCMTDWYWMCDRAFTITQLKNAHMLLVFCLHFDVHHDTLHSKLLLREDVTPNQWERFGYALLMGYESEWCLSKTDEEILDRLVRSEPPFTRHLGVYDHSPRALDLLKATRDRCDHHVGRLSRERRAPTPTSVSDSEEGECDDDAADDTVPPMTRLDTLIALRAMMTRATKTSK